MNSVLVLWLILGLCSTVSLLWTWFAFRMIRACLAVPPARPVRCDDSATLDGPTIHVVIPARNEEVKIGTTIRSVRDQIYPKLTITVVNDRSTDRTGEILESLAEQGDRVPIQILKGRDRPEGWVGKTWALAQAIEQIDESWILFLDADTDLHPEAIARAWQLCQDEELDMISLLRRRRCHTLTQSSAAIALAQILGQLYPLDRVKDPNDPRALADGGFILIKRETYQQAGTHQAIRGEIVEDIKLAERVKRIGGRIAAVPAPRLASTHMYGNLAQVWAGLKKNAYAGMDYQPHKLVTGAIAGTVLVLMPGLALLIGYRAILYLLLAPTINCIAFMSDASVSDRWDLPILNNNLSQFDWSFFGVGIWGLIAQTVACWPLTRFFGTGSVAACSLLFGGPLYIAICLHSAWQYHTRGQVTWSGEAMNIVPNLDRQPPTSPPAQGSASDD